MQAKIQDILIISTPDDTPKIQALLGDGKNLGINLHYEIQYDPKGIADAFIIGKSFVDHRPVALVLGDNLFHGGHLTQCIQNTTPIGATVFAYPVPDPERFGVVTVDAVNMATSIEEKPIRPKSNLAVTGLYFYDSDVTTIASGLTPSNRGELEITDINRAYLNTQKCHVSQLDNTTTWMDMGTYDSLLAASKWVCHRETVGSEKVGCPEAVAYKNKWIDANAISHLADDTPAPYSQYLRDILE